MATQDDVRRLALALPETVRGRRAPIRDLRLRRSQGEGLRLGVVGADIAESLVERFFVDVLLERQRRA